MSLHSGVSYLTLGRASVATHVRSALYQLKSSYLTPTGSGRKSIQCFPLVLGRWILLRDAQQRITCAFSLHNNTKNWGKILLESSKTTFHPCQEANRAHSETMVMYAYAKKRRTTKKGQKSQRTNPWCTWCLCCVPLSYYSGAETVHHSSQTSPAKNAKSRNTLSKRACSKRKYVKYKVWFLG